MLRAISVTICNRISSAAAVLLPNDQDLCAARPAGVPPRRQGALFDPRNQYHYGPCGIEGLVKVILHVPMQIELRRALYIIAAGHGRRFQSAAMPKVIFLHITKSRILIAVYFITSGI